MTLAYSHFGLPNTPPYVVGASPTGDVGYDIPISLSINDDRGYVVQNTIDLSLICEAEETSLYPIINGVIQAGFSGTITANIYGGYDIEITNDSEDGWGTCTWDVTAYAEDDFGDTMSYDWQFSSSVVAAVVSVMAVGRGKIEIIFDRAIRVRSVSNIAEAPVDRYSPIDWIGTDSDAANPDNYSLSRVPDGFLSGAGEAADIIATWAEENRNHIVVYGSYVYSTNVFVYTDYQMTAYADYRIDISNIVISEIPMPTSQHDFVGYVVSQVPRTSLKFIESLPQRIVSDDDYGTGDLRKFLNVLQELYDRIVEDVDVFFLELCTVDRIRDEFIDALLWDLGDPFSDLLDLNFSQKRKLAGVLVQMYREKGTCVGIINAVRVFVGIELSGCQEPWQSAWRLAGGSYPDPTGPDQDELGVSTIIGPSEGDYRNVFWLLSPFVLSANQEKQIRIIADYIKPVYTSYSGVIEV